MKNLSTMTDHELVALYEQGNDSAFDVLLSRYQEYVYSYILFLVHNREDADDVFQETFSRAIMAVRNHRYSCTGKFSAWLIRIAHNLAIDCTRDTAAALANTRDVNDSHVLNNLKYSEQAHDTHVMERQKEATIHHMLTYLPENQQEIIRLRFYDDLSFREIAQQKGISINTALGRMRYALINLRRLVNRHQISLVS